jgi:hypothetical protein
LGKEAGSPEEEQVEPMAVEVPNGTVRGDAEAI